MGNRTAGGQGNLGRQDLPKPPEPIRIERQVANVPLRKALAIGNAAVYDCAERCLGELANHPNESDIRRAVQAFRDWEWRKRKDLRLTPVQEILPEDKAMLAVEAVAMVQNVKDRLMTSPKTGLMIPTGREFTDLDNHDTRRRVVELTTNAVALSYMYEKPGEVKEMMDRVMTTAPASIPEDFKQRIIDRVWVVRKGV